MPAINLAAKLALFDGYWQPRVVGQFNGHDLLVVKVKGEFVWHRHDDTDDFFLVLQGRITIRMHEGDVTLGPGEVFGLAGLLGSAHWRAEFSALTPCVLYRVDREYLEPCLEARREIGEAMERLFSYRQQRSEELLSERPVVVAKPGLFGWLRRHAPGRRAS